MHDLAFNLLILTRITASILFGFGIGLERELTNKYAGLRTHILVCLGSSVFTILSIYAFPTAVDQTHPQAYGDPARIAAQILTGIGFIGGGTVLRHGSSVYGLTTAATLWVAAGIGMACGAGMIDVAFFATFFSVLVLVLVRLFEQKVLVKSTKNIKRLKITISCTTENTENIYNAIIEDFGHLYEISKKHSDKNSDLMKIIAIMDVNGKKPLEALHRKFQKIEGMESIIIQENDE